MQIQDAVTQQLWLVNEINDAKLRNKENLSNAAEASRIVMEELKKRQISLAEEAAALKIKNEQEREALRQRLFVSVCCVMKLENAMRSLYLFIIPISFILSLPVCFT